LYNQENRKDMSSPSENLTIKQPIRRLEIQINNFNVAIPHHVNLLKRHKNNIKKVRANPSAFYFTFPEFSIQAICIFAVSRSTQLGTGTKGTYKCLSNHQAVEGVTVSNGYS